MEQLFTFFLLPAAALVFAVLAIGGAVFVAGVARRWRGWAFGTVLMMMVVASVSSIVLSFRRLTLSDQGLMNVAEGDGASGLLSKLILAAVIGCSIALCLAWLFDWNKKMRGFSRFASRGMLPPSDITWAFMVFYVAFSLLPIFFGKVYYVHVSLIYPFFIYLALYLYMEVSEVDPAMMAKYCLAVIVFGSLAAAVLTPSSAFQPGYNGLLPGFKSRLWGVTAHANSLGAVACAYFLMELAVPARRRWLHLVLLAVAWLTMIMSQSKTSILTAMLGGTLMLLMQGRAYLKSKNRGYNENAGLIMAALLLGGCIFVLFVGTWVMFFDLNVLTALESKLDARAVGDLSTGTGRLWIWTAAINGGMENPLFGQGASFWNLENRMRLGLSGAVTAHNLYLQVFSRSGFVGLITLLVFMYILIRYAIRASRATQGASLAMLAVILVRSMTEVPISPNSVLGAEFFATMAYIYFIIDRGARPVAAARQVPHGAAGPFYFKQREGST